MNPNQDEEDTAWYQGEPPVNVDGLIFSEEDIQEFLYTPEKFTGPPDAWWGVAYSVIIDPGFIPSRPPFRDLTNVKDILNWRLP
jgi:hypothetical protein